MPAEQEEAAIETTDDDEGKAQADIGDGEQHQEQRPCTPKSHDEQGGEALHSNSRGIGATSLQRYLISVGDTLTPDEDDELLDSGKPKTETCRVDMFALRAEARSARDVLTMVLDDMRSRADRSSARHADISQMATSILARAREIVETRGTLLGRAEVGTQTDSCDGLGPLTELRVQEESDMVELMLLTNRVSALMAREGDVAAGTPPDAQAACPLHAAH